MPSAWAPGADVVAAAAAGAAAVAEFVRGPPCRGQLADPIAHRRSLHCNPQTVHNHPGPSPQ